MHALVRPPRLLRHLYPGAWWRMNPAEKKIYLTFDDGPVPGITPAALSVLKQFHVPATFFCVGENVKTHPEIFQQVIAEGHVAGNHTFRHVDGWKSTRNDYLREVNDCADRVPSGLFRPPYGHLRHSQFRALSRKYKIVMWDVLTCDFDNNISPEECLQLALRYARNGSVVVFHDSEKAKGRMLFALPRFIEEMMKQGFEFGALAAGEDPRVTPSPVTRAAHLSS